MHVHELFDLTDKVALITGGSRGIGLEVATALGEAGAAVVITARREGWLQKAEEDLRAAGIRCLSLACDVSVPEQVQSTVAAVLREFQTIDILVNNAGISWGAPANMMPLEKWRAVLDVNVTGCFLMAQAVGSDMIRRGVGGKIINMASIAGMAGSPSEIFDAVGYSTSKGAVLSLTRDLAVKWARHGIHVNAIAPGFFPTRMTSGILEKSLPQIEAAIPMGRIGQTSELKGVAVFLASAASDYVTGQVIAVDGGASARW